MENTQENFIFQPEDFLNILPEYRSPCVLIDDTVYGRGLSLQTPNIPSLNNQQKMIGILPAIYPEWLGDRSFCLTHNVRFPYIAGAMANGIASVNLVEAIVKAGGLSFFGSAGLSLEQVKTAMFDLQNRLGQKSFGMNLIHSPHEPDLEQAIVDLYISNNIHRISAAAYMNLTPMLAQFAIHGLHTDQKGKIQRKNYIFAKISHPDVAKHFIQPVPQNMIDNLLEAGKITAMEANLATKVPVSEDITVESDSGGHTDNRVLSAVFPEVLALKQEICTTQNYSRTVRIGAAGGIGTPSALAAAYALGAAYVVTASINQPCVESGMSEKGKTLLCKVRQEDVMMAPAADMFEMGVKVQVLKRGSMFGVRAQRLYDLYQKYANLNEIPQNIKLSLEKDIFKDSLESTWRHTAAFFRERDPKQLQKAEHDPKFQMALLFRAYLGQSSKWAIAGKGDRHLDYQIWCGPALGGFNAWVKNTHLEAPENRHVDEVMLQLLDGACRIIRAKQLRDAGYTVSDRAFFLPPCKQITC